MFGRFGKKRKELCIALENNNTKKQVFGVMFAISIKKQVRFLMALANTVNKNIVSYIKSVENNQQQKGFIYG